MSHIRIADGGRVGQFETVNRDLDWTDAACRGMDINIFYPEQQGRHPDCPHIAASGRPTCWSHARWAKEVRR